MLAISGTSGFLGGYVVNYLKGTGVEYLSLNLREALPSQLPDEVNSVLHLAGKAHDLKKVAGAEEYFQINTELTKRLFEVFINSKAKVFIYVSSVKAVADYVGNKELVESDVPNPRTPYGESKLAAEVFLRSKPLPEGKRLYILRPCMIHGPGNKGNFNLLYQIVKKGIPWPLGSFENRRSFLSVDNFCFVLDQILLQRLEPGTYHLADTESLSTNELVRLIASELNTNANIIPIPQGLIKGIARMGDLFPLPLNSERLEKLTENYVVSNHKLLTALGGPLPINAELGMRKTIRSFIKTEL